MNFNKICCYDMETDSSNPRLCNPVQLASVIINPRTLKIEKNSGFNVVIKPDDLVKDRDSYVKDHLDTIEWHAKVQKCKPEEVVDSWLNGISEKEAFIQYKEYLLQYHTRTNRKCKFSAPIKAGANIIRFDNIIMERLCKKYGEIDKSDDMTLFHPRDQIDTMMIMFNWFENLDQPKSFSMDILRPFFGISTAGSHDALKDVMDTAEIIIRFMMLHRRYADKVQFKGSFIKNATVITEEITNE